MSRIFNTSGTCYPDLHYMVNTDQQADEIIRNLIGQNQYFTINRARQYGKTTILNQLYTRLRNDTIIFFISFEELGTASFRDESEFCAAFAQLLNDAIEFEPIEGISKEIAEEIAAAAKSRDFQFRQLSNLISRMCITASRPIILMVDEVDSASNNQIFLDFLGMLRNKYLQRRRRKTFQSVILSGVYDIKNLKQKLRPEDTHKYNSPWNIAADFKIDMSFSEDKIAGMLLEYEEDCHTNMDVAAVSREIYARTSGYPYLVSLYCKILDEQIAGTEDYPEKGSAWTYEGILAAERILLKESNMLFDDMIKKIDEYSDLSKMLHSILFSGSKFMFEADNPLISLGVMLGFLKEKDSSVAVANRIFELKLYNYFISEAQTASVIYKEGVTDKNEFVIDGMLQMELVLKKFCEHFSEVYAERDASFIEEYGRKIFLLYLKPIINGTGNYYIEPETRDGRRADIIVDYCGRQFVIECKIWHGEEYKRRGEAQLFDYLTEFRQEKGYLLSFNFNKNKVPGVKKIEYSGKFIVEAVV